MSLSLYKGLYRGQSTGPGGQALDANFTKIADYMAKDEDMSFYRLYRRKEIERFIGNASQRRVDIALIGDSNIFSAGTSGYGVSFEYEWGRRFGFYATGTRPFRPLDTNFTLGWGFTAGTGHAVGTQPAHVAALQAPAGFGSGFTYRDSGAAGTPYADLDLFLSKNHLNGIKAAFKWVFSYATFAAGAGNMAPIVRKDSSFVYLATDSFPTNTGTNGVAVRELSVAADPARDEHIWFCLQAYNADYGSLTGPYAALYQRVVWSDKTKGVGVNAMIAQGGMPTRSAAECLASLTQAQFDEWARLAVGQQDDTPMLLVQILQGQNDTSDSADSVGPSPTASNTAAGVVDNTAAVINRLRLLWIGAGYDVNDLFFLIGPYHPQEESRRKWGRDLDNAFATYADSESNVAVASRSRLTTTAALRAQSVFADSTDAHLSTVGYYIWANFALDALIPPMTSVIKGEAVETYYGLLWDDTGCIWDSTVHSFVPYVEANYANYVLAMTQLDSASFFKISLPIQIRRPVTFRFMILQQAGGSPASTDTLHREMCEKDFNSASAATLAEVR